MKQKSYENYPCRIVVISNILWLLNYAIGIYIFFQAGIAFLAAYILYISWLEIRLLKKSCVNCYYYGKFCAFGRGKISALLFRKGNPRLFNMKKIGWKDMIHDFLVSLAPIVAGIILLVLNFRWLLLGLVVLMVVLMTAGNAFIRGSLACKYCKQRELGCPAQQLFGKKKQA